MTDLPALGDNENLGREVFDSEKAKRAAGGNIIPKIFLERIGVDNLSVDRLDHAPDHMVAAVGVANAAARGSGAFYGWAVVTVHDASLNGRKVYAVPVLNNRYHAEIHLPLVDGQELRDQQKAHAVDLAKNATWRPRP